MWTISFLSFIFYLLQFNPIELGAIIGICLLSFVSLFIYKLHSRRTHTRKIKHRNKRKKRKKHINIQYNGQEILRIGCKKHKRRVKIINTPSTYLNYNPHTRRSVQKHASCKTPHHIHTNKHSFSDFAHDIQATTVTTDYVTFVVALFVITVTVEISVCDIILTLLCFVLAHMLCVVIRAFIKLVNNLFIMIWNAYLHFINYYIWFRTFLGLYIIITSIVQNIEYTLLWYCLIECRIQQSYIYQYIVQCCALLMKTEIQNHKLLTIKIRKYNITAIFTYTSETLLESLHLFIQNLLSEYETTSSYHLNHCTINQTTGRYYLNNNDSFSRKLTDFNFGVNDSIEVVHRDRIMGTGGSGAHNCNENIHPCLISYSIAHQVILSLIAGQSIQLTVNDRAHLSFVNLNSDTKKPYQSLSDLLYRIHQIKISARNLRTLIWWMKNNPTIALYWTSIEELSSFVIDRETVYVSPPINTCPKCKYDLYVKGISIFELQNDQMHYQNIAEIVLRCRNADCERNQKTVGYNYFVNEQDKKQMWSSSIQGPNRFPVQSPNNKDSHIGYLPEFVRWGHKYYSWRKLNTVRADSARGKQSFGTISELMDLKKCMNSVNFGESIADHYSSMRHQNSTHLLNAYILFRCLFFSCLFQSLDIILNNFEKKKFT
eukprot:192611_1